MTPNPVAARTTIAIGLGIAIFLLFSLISSLGYFTTEHLGNDFSVYWRVANGPVADAYVWRPGGYGFPYAPTMLLWIQPLKLIPLGPAFIAFDLVSIAAFVFAVRPHLPKLAIVLCLISPSLFGGLLTGQVSILLTAIILAACATPNRIAAGVLFGIVASIKPQLVLMAPLFMIVTGDWKAFVASGASFAAAVLLSLLLFGTAPWHDWIASLSTFHDVVTNSNIIKKGVTPGIVAERFGWPRSAGVLVGAVTGIVLILVGRKSTPVERLVLIGTASLLAAPYALPYDLAVFMPLIAPAIVGGEITAAVAAIPVYPLPLFAACRELIRRSPETEKPSRNRAPARCLSNRNDYDMN